MIIKPKVDSWRVDPQRLKIEFKRWENRGYLVSLSLLKQMEIEFKNESATWFGNWDNQQIVLETIKEAEKRIAERSRENIKEQRRRLWELWSKNG